MGEERRSRAERSCEWWCAQPNSSAPRHCRHFACCHCTRDRCNGPIEVCRQALLHATGAPKHVFRSALLRNSSVVSAAWGYTFSLF